MARWVGIASLLLLAFGINAAVWQQAIFSAWVLGPWAVAAVLGVVWVVLSIQQGSARAVLEGRAIGGFNALVSSIVFLAICIVVYAIVARWDRSWDLTREGRRDLSQQTVQVLQTMTREVEVICFFLDVDDELLAIGKEKTLRFLAQCEKYTDLLKVEVEDPQSGVARLQSLEVNFASPQGTIVVRAGTRKRVITLSGGSPRLEERDFTNAVINVLRNSEPKVAYLTGHGERSLDDLENPSGAGGIRTMLGNESYTVEPLLFDQSDPVVPSDVDMLVINNPNGDLRPTEVLALDAFMNRGGRMLVMLDPWLGVQEGASHREFLRPWLEERFGIVVGSDMAITDQQSNALEIQMNITSDPFAEVDDIPPAYRGAYNAGHPITQGFDQVTVMTAARTVDVSGPLPEKVVATRLLRTTPDFWAETDLMGLSRSGDASKQAAETEGPLPLAVAAVERLEGETAEQMSDTRIVVIGNSSFVSNAQITYPGNLNLFMNLFGWFERIGRVDCHPALRHRRPAVGVVGS